MIKVLFVVLPDTSLYFNQLYLNYLIASCKKDKLLTIDVFFYNEEELLNKISIYEPNIVYLHIDFMDFNINMLIANKIKAINPKIHLTCGYLYPSYYYKKILSNTIIDTVIIGEPELSFRDLCHCLKKDISFFRVKGLAFKDNGHVVVNQFRESEKELDNLPFPDRQNFEATNSYYVFGSRGCANNCTFCCKNNLFLANKKPIQRFRTMNNLISELDELSEKHNCKHVIFGDATFCYPKKPEERLEELYSHLITKDYWMQFFMFLCPTQINKRTCAALKRLIDLGLHRVFVGIETGNSEDLKLYNKNTSLALSKRALEKLQTLKKENDLNYYFEPEYGFMNFNPYSTFEKVRENVDFLQACGVSINPNKIISKVLLYPDTTLAKMVIEDGLYNSYDDLGYVNDKFENSEIGLFYNELVYYYNLLRYKRTEGVIILANRYIRFFHKNDLIESTMKLFDEYEQVTSDYTIQIFDRLYNKHKYKFTGDGDSFVKVAGNHLDKIYSQLDLNVKKISLKLVRTGEFVK